MIQRRGSRGLTLVEVMLTLVILVIVLGAAYMVLISTLEAQVNIDSSLQADRLGTRILSLVASDLGALRIYRLEKGPAFRVTDDPSAGLTREVHFLCTTPSILPDGDRTAPVNEVGYALEPNQGEKAGFYSLFRQEDFFADSESMSGGKRVLLHDRVRVFRIVWLGADETLPSSTRWMPTDKEQYPRRAEVFLSMSVDGEGTGDLAAKDFPEYRYKTAVTLASEVREGDVPKKKEGEEGDGTGEAGGEPDTFDEGDVGKLK